MTDGVMMIDRSIAPLNAARAHRSRPPRDRPKPPQVNFEKFTGPCLRLLGRIAQSERRLRPLPCCVSVESASMLWGAPASIDAEAKRRCCRARSIDQIESNQSLRSP